MNREAHSASCTECVVHCPARPQVVRTSCAPGPDRRDRSANGHSARTADAYLTNLIVTVRAELYAAPAPRNEVQEFLWRSFELFLLAADTVAPHLAYRVLQAMRGVIETFHTAEAPAGHEPP